jgi:hypothetical protein
MGSGFNDPQIGKGTSSSGKRARKLVGAVYVAVMLCFLIYLFYLVNR